MDIIECYRLLQLTSVASQEEVKAAYRRLARQLHPDVNADHQAQEQFIRVTEAYKVLIKIAASRPVAVPLKTPAAQSTPQTSQASAPKVKISVQRPEPQQSQPKQPQPSQTEPSQPQPQSSSQPSASASPVPSSVPPSSPTPIAEPSLTHELSVAEQKLKLDTHRQLADLMKRRSLPRAIATVEALQARLPNDPEIRQWQALIYQRWGRQLIEERKLNQAKAYLKKALKTDPHNKTLWNQVEQDFKRIENTY
jgi:tetratricopeptide (TPR) repeat protein